MFLPTFGSLGIGGVVAFAIGALMLIDTDVPGFGIPLPLIAARRRRSARCSCFGVSRLALRARRRPGGERLGGDDRQRRRGARRRLRAGGRDGWAARPAASARAWRTLAGASAAPVARAASDGARHRAAAA